MFERGCSGDGGGGGGGGQTVSTSLFNKIEGMLKPLVRALRCKTEKIVTVFTLKSNNVLVFRFTEMKQSY